jgi:hypothetical protein
VADLNHVLFDFRPESWQYNGQAPKSNQKQDLIPTRYLHYPIQIRCEPEIKVFIWLDGASLVEKVPPHTMSIDECFDWIQQELLSINTPLSVYSVCVCVPNQLMKEEDVWVVHPQDIQLKACQTSQERIEYVLSKRVVGEQEEDERKPSVVFREVPTGTYRSIGEYLDVSSRVWQLMNSSKKAQDWYKGLVRPHAAALLIIRSGVQDVQFWNIMVRAVLSTMEWYGLVDSRYHAKVPIFPQWHEGWVKTKWAIEYSEELCPVEKETYTQIPTTLVLPSISVEVEVVQSKLEHIKEELMAVDRWPKTSEDVTLTFVAVADLMRSRVDVIYQGKTYSYQPKYRLKADGFTSIIIDEYDQSSKEQTQPTPITTTTPSKQSRDGAPSVALDPTDPNNTQTLHMIVAPDSSMESSSSIDQSPEKTGLETRPRPESPDLLKCEAPSQETNLQVVSTKSDPVESQQHENKCSTPPSLPLTTPEKSISPMPSFTMDEGTKESQEPVVAPVTKPEPPVHLVSLKKVQAPKKKLKMEDLI